METQFQSNETANPQRIFLEAERLPVKPYVVLTGVALLVWLVVAWWLADRRVENSANDAYTMARKNATTTSIEMADGLARNLIIYHGMPATIGRNRSIQNALVGFRSDEKLPRDKLTRQRLWTENKAYAEVSRILAESLTDVPSFSVLWVMNTAGDAIASSNAGLKDSFVGSNYTEREYFQQAMAGHFGKQFAVGKVTGIPGLFFSAPVISKNRTVGVIAAKINLNYLSTWVNQADAFITDPFGVVILAKNKPMEFHAVPGNSLANLSADERIRRYRISDVPVLPISPWRDEMRRLDYSVGTLITLGRNPMPMIHASRSIPGEDLVVNVLTPVPALADRTNELMAEFTVNLLGGLVVIPLIFGTVFYLRNRQRVMDYRERQAHIEHLSTHDPLTGLFSRVVSQQLISHGIAVAARKNTHFAVIFVDLDRFKDVNDSLGHEAGDQVLCEMAGRIKAEIRASDPVIRIGGDEFVILIGDLETANDAARLASKINEAMSAPFDASGTSVTLSASLGIAMYPGDGEDASTLLRNADSALYRTKENGRNGFCFYLPSMNNEILARLTIEGELRQGISGGQLVLHYQPVYSLERKCVVGCEALVRWQHPARGLLGPGEFIHIAETACLMPVLSEWVLNEASRQMQAWRISGMDILSVAINLSPSVFRKFDVTAMIESALEASGLPSQCLAIELTEGTLMERPDDAGETLHRLKSLGIGVLIDDFGTGYSSLAYLKYFDADVLKIDRSFVRNMESDTNDRAIIQAIIQLADSLDYRVIAEGVETEQQVNLLKWLGCKEIQGYWYSRPLSATDFAEFILAGQSRELVPLV